MKIMNAVHARGRGVSTHQPRIKGLKEAKTSFCLLIATPFFGSNQGLDFLLILINIKPGKVALCQTL